MEYAVLILVLFGAIYLLVRFAKSESECRDGPRGCDRCSRVARPPAERLHQINSPPAGEKPPADGMEY